MYDKREEIEREYKLKLALIEREQKQCSHVWESTIYNPEKKMVPYGCKTIVQGSDIWSEPEGYREENVPRWSRRCEKCGKVEYTYKQKPIISDYEADFSWFIYVSLNMLDYRGK